MSVLKSAGAALASAIFGPWMNISGSVPATWWHRKPVNEPDQAEQTARLCQKGDYNESG